MKRFIRRPSPAMVVALVALVTALAGTAYAAQTINGGAIKKQTIGGGKIKPDTLTGFQINNNKLGVVPSAERATHTYWVTVTNPAGPNNASIVHASATGITALEGNNFVGVTFPANVSACADIAARNNAGTTVPTAGTAQTNFSAVNANALEVRTRDDAGANQDGDFHLVVVCP